MDTSEIEPAHDEIQLSPSNLLNQGDRAKGSTSSGPPNVIVRRGKTRRRAARKEKNKGKQAAYDVDVTDLASNTLALFHNALRHEIDLYDGFAAPVLDTHVPFNDADDLVDGLLDRWTVLSRFMVLVSRIEEVVCASVFEDVNVGFRREALAVEKAHKAIAERLLYAYELFVRATSNAAGVLDKSPSSEALKKFADATAAQIRFARDTAERCEKFVLSVDDLGDEPLRHPHLEREVFDTLKKVCREENFGFTAVQLFRWSKKEGTIKSWMTRHSTSKAERDKIMSNVEEWIKMYSERDHVKDLEETREKREVTKAFSSSSSTSSSD